MESGIVSIVVANGLPLTNTITSSTGLEQEVSGLVTIRWNACVAERLTVLGVGMLAEAGGFKVLAGDHTNAHAAGIDDPFSIADVP